MNTKILEICKTCIHGEQKGKSYFCTLRCASCSVPRDSDETECVNYKNSVIAGLISGRGSFTGKGG